MPNRKVPVQSWKYRIYVNHLVITCIKPYLQLSSLVEDGTSCCFFIFFFLGISTCILCNAGGLMQFNFLRCF